MVIATVSALTQMRHTVYVCACVVSDVRCVWCTFAASAFVTHSWRQTLADNTFNNQLGIRVAHVRTYPDTEHRSHPSRTRSHKFEGLRNQTPNPPNKESITAAPEWLVRTSRYRAQAAATAAAPLPVIYLRAPSTQIALR